MRKFLLIATVLAVTSTPALADHDAGTLATVCRAAFKSEASNDLDKAVRTMCRSKVEGFMDGYRLSVERISKSKCYPGNDQINVVLGLFMAFMGDNPDLAGTNYSKILKEIIDKKYHCGTD